MGSYCCEEKKCFILETLEVDGLACRKCQSFGQCFCRCNTYMSKQKYCCSKKCCILSLFEELDIAYVNCLYYSHCYCQCKYRTKWMRLKNSTEEWLRSLKREK